MEERTLENEVTVDELEENLTGDMEQEQPEEESREADEMMAAIRAGLAELFEDGWTTAEMDGVHAGRAGTRRNCDGARCTACGMRLLTQEHGGTASLRCTDGENDGGGFGKAGQPNRAYDGQAIRCVFAQSACGDDGRAKGTHRVTTLRRKPRNPF